MNNQSNKKLTEKEFEQIFRLNYASLFAFGFKICGDKSFTKDAIQSLFLEIWEKRNQLNEVTYWNAYLKKSLHRKITTALKKQQSNALKFTNLNLSKSTPSYEKLLIEFQTNQTQKDNINLAVSELPEGQRRVLEMRFREGLSYEEIAELTGKSKQTIYNQVFSAIKKLRRALFSLIMF